MKSPIYNDVYQITQVQYSNGTTITYTYDALGNRTGKTVTGSIFQITTSVNPVEAGSVSGNLGTYNYNQNVVLTASPLSADYDFVSWTEDTSVVCVTPMYSFLATQNRTLCANFVQRHQVGLATYPSSVGQVTGDGRYDHGALATARAESSAGYCFLYWVDDATGLVVSYDSNYTFVVNAATHLTAHFSALHLVSTLVSPADAGSVTGGGYYLHDSVATLMAISNPYFVFNNWTDGSNIVSSDSLYTFPVSRNITLTANFLHQYRVVTYASPSTGGYTSGDSTYREGSLVSVTAESHDHFRFSHWSRNDTVVSMDSTYSFIITKNTSLVAHFVMQHRVDVVANPISGGDVIGSGVFDYGSYAHIQAVPREGYIFSRWTESNFPLTLNSVDSILVNSDRTLVANFVRSYQISTSVYPETAGSVNGAGMYNVGSLVVLNAVAEPYWTFQNWTDDNNNVVATNELVYFNATRDTHLTANFSYTPPTFIVNAYPQPLSAGNVFGMDRYVLDSLVTMTAVPNRHYTFLHWTENDSVVSVDSIYVFNAQNNRNLVAVFAYTPETYTISTVAIPTEGGNVTGGGSYTYAATAYLSASENLDYTFSGWLDAGIIIDTNPSISFTVTRSRDLVASFLYTPPVCNVTVSVTPEEAGWIADQSGMPFSGGTYSPGDTIILLPMVNPCYHFLDWHVGDSVISYPPIISYILPEGNLHFNAQFDRDSIGHMGEIFGPENVCLNTEQEYITNAVVNVTSYRWTDVYGNQVVTSSPKVTVSFDSVIDGDMVVSAYGNCGVSDTITKHIVVSPSFASMIIDTVDAPYDWEGEIRNESGIYTVRYSTIDGCDSTITLDLTITPVGIDNIEECSILVYPNPSSTCAVIDLTNAVYEVNDMSFVIYDNLGRRVFSDKLSSVKTIVDLSTYAVGEYFIYLTHCGDIVSIHRIVKAK